MDEQKQAIGTNPHDDLPPGRYAVTTNAQGNISAEKRADGSWHLCDGTGWSEPFADGERVLNAEPWREWIGSAHHQEHVAKQPTPVTHIVPTVGRVVWYWPNTHETGGRVVGDIDQPMRADICFVHSDGTVTLSVNDHAGCAFSAIGITLHQGDAAGCSLPRPFATWMPYQKGQAAKTEAAEKSAAMNASTLELMARTGFQVEMADLQLDMLREQVRQLRLMNDAQELNNEQQRASMRDLGEPGKPVDQLPEVPGMPPHQVRMRFERDELQTKINKLAGFIGSAEHEVLDDHEKELLDEQMDHMVAYMRVLQDRIALFNEQQDAA